MEYRAAILHSLDNNLTTNACFIAERLFYQDTTDLDACHLLALALQRHGDLERAHHLTTASRHIGCAYVHAQTCLSLKRYRQGIIALESIAAKWNASDHMRTYLENRPRVYTPDASVIFCLLGHLCRKGDIPRKAIEYYVLAVKANPYLWEAFDGLLLMGVDMQVRNVFPDDAMTLPVPSITTSTAASALPSQSESASCDTPDVFTQKLRAGFSFRPVLPSGSMADDAGTPGPMTPTVSQVERSKVDPATRPKPRFPDVMAPKFGMKPRTEKPVLPRQMVGPNGLEDAAMPPAGPVRHSNRLLTSFRGPTSRLGASVANRDLKKLSKQAKKSPSQSSSFDEVSRTLDGEGSNLEGELRPSSSSSTDADRPLLSLLRRIGEGCYALSKYQCARAIECFRSLETAMQSSPFVLARLGRAYFEMANYEEAQACYKQLRKADPFRVEDTEYHSTCLWHLRKEVELSYLAHEIFDLDRLSPQSWCILANCFSLQREHEQALRCIKRAIRLDPSFAYAHTLEGHEYVANEEYERAQTSFRGAIRVDKRHYNAWYGLGMTYLKIGKFSEAEYHYGKAAQINPSNAVLVCCIGIVYERSKNFTEALVQYQRACELAPTNALARFKKAKALIKQREYRAAMADLMILKDLAPDEANVHYLLGRTYKSLGDKVAAMKHLTIALNLDNKASHMIKEAIEKIDEVDEGFEDS